MSNTLNKVEVLCNYLMKNHMGREKAVSSRMLEAAFQLSGREIRKCINSLRCNGFLICSDTTGYYYAATQQEINNTVKRLNSLSSKIADAKNGLQKTNLNNHSAVLIELRIELN